MSRPIPPRAIGIVGGVALVVFGSVFLVHDHDRISARFGLSFDGGNASVWGQASRAIREQGLLESEFGARPVYTDPGKRSNVYASHPPLIASEAALAESIFGDEPAATRAPAYLGSLLVLVLMYLLLRSLGTSAVAAAGGVILALGCPMFMVYGTMLDTPITSFPFEIALLLLFQRSSTDLRRSPFVDGSVALLSVLASWQGAAVAGCVAAASLARERRKSTPFIVGFVAGVALLGAWILWTRGSFAGSFGDLRARSTTNVGIATSVRGQLEVLRHLIAPVGVILGVLGCVLALRNAPSRITTGIILAVGIGFGLGLWNLMYEHEYWSYWLLLPAAVGCSFSLDWIAERAGAVLSAPLVWALILAVSLALAVLYGTRTSRAERAVNRGIEFGQVASSVRYPEHQRWAWFARLPAGSREIAYYARRPSRVLRSTDGVDRDDVVVIGDAPTTGPLHGAWSRLVKSGVIPPHAHVAAVTVGTLEETGS